MQDIGAVIFDCDGTLVDSEPALFTSVVAQVRHLHPDSTLDESQLHHLKGQNIVKVMALASQLIGRPLPPDFEARARERMAQIYRDGLQALPGALDVLRHLRVPYCVASNGPRHKMDVTLGVTGLLPHLEGRIFSGYDLGLFKPDPALFLHAAREMGVAPGRCAVVEDSHPGIEAGLAAGMTVYVLPAAAPLPADWLSRVRPIDRLHALLNEPWNR